jgi:methylglutaconyl-CoA hydratase
MDWPWQAMKFRTGSEAWCSEGLAHRQQEKTVNYKTIVVSDTARIRTITLNRPERRNAMTQEMQTELISAFEEAGLSESRVLVLTGAGEAFCSGLDLSELQTLKDKTAAQHRIDAERIGRLFLTLYELPLPTIAAVHGPAIAGGTGLATICDFTMRRKLIGSGW